MTADPFLSPDDVADELRCSADSVLRAVARGDLIAVKYGRLVRIRRSALDAFLAAHTTGDALSTRRRRRVA